MKTTIFKKGLSILLMLFVFSNNSNATHLMGGEITWECVKSGPDIGKYIFTVKTSRIEEKCCDYMDTFLFDQKNIY